MASDDLGPLLAQHQYEGNGCLGALMLLGTLGIGLGLFGLMGWAAMNGSLGGEPADVAAGVCVASFFVLIGMGLSISSLRSRLKNERFAIHDRGIAHTSRGTEQRIPWTEVTALVSKVTELQRRGSSTLIFDYHLYASGDRRLHLNSTQHSDVGPGTGDLLRAKTFEVLWPHYKEVVENGGTVKLDALAIDLQGLRSGAQEVPFEGLQTVAKDGPKLVFTHANGTETRVSAVDQPNVHLAIALCEQFKR